MVPPYLQYTECFVAVQQQAACSASFEAALRADALAKILLGAQHWQDTTLPSDHAVPGKSFSVDSR